MKKPGIFNSFPGLASLAALSSLLVDSGKSELPSTAAGKKATQPAPPDNKKRQEARQKELDNPKADRARGILKGTPETSVSWANLEVSRFGYNKLGPEYMLCGCGPVIAAGVTGCNPFEARTWFLQWAKKHDKAEIDGVQLKGTDERAMAEFFDAFGIQMYPVTLADIQRGGWNGLTPRHVVLDAVWWPATSGLSWMIRYQGMAYHLNDMFEPTDSQLMNLIVDSRYVLFHPSWRFKHKGTLEFMLDEDES